MKSIKNQAVIIHGFMIEDLYLTGNELLVYAWIYCLSGDGIYKPVRSSFLRNWCISPKNGKPITRRNFLFIIEKLEKKKLILVKREKGKPNQYLANIKPLIEIYKEEGEEKPKTIGEKPTSLMDKAKEIVAKHEEKNDLSSKEELRDLLINTNWLNNPQANGR